MQVAQPIRDPEKITELQDVLKNHSMRDWLLFTIGINSGLHLNDILRLRVRDVKDRNEISITEEKTGKSKSFWIDDTLKSYIGEYVQYMGDEDYMFPSQKTGKPIKRIRVYRILNEAAKRVGLQDIGTHTLRKTFGYHYYQRTKNISVLRDLFNHSAPSVTFKYIGIDKRNSG
ncbi:tyrosine-type recombinase/integrase [Paenibacillus chitinolyticus]|uniref:tyrosine-type recombinase/integrase n=1 Tax=Paenibacillus chitinolyticus TaxID=79263 RepID=UPI0026E4AA2B|nr:tyrosine-type recombinase/integrase [Paenibacillus chitinolyticus]GKS10514.1 putative integrase/recombinase YoeC [Paenibacillus chitinolyticus]